MTLSALANFICGKVNQSETEDVAACKGFLTRRHEMVWQSDLWKDSQVEYRQTVDPTGYLPSSNWLPTKGVLLLPPDIELVMAARTDERKLNVKRHEYYYRIDYDAFAKSGSAGEFIPLPKCVWALDSARPIYAMRSDVADAGLTMTSDVADLDGVGETRVAKLLDEDYKLLVASSDRVSSASKPTTAGKVTLWAGGAEIEPDSVEDLFILWNNTDLIGVTLSYIAGNATNITSGVFSATSDAVFVCPQSLIVVTKPTGETWTGSLQRIYTCGISAAASDTNFRLRESIRLVDIPDKEVTLRVLGKRVCPNFTADNDQPAIRSMDNLLIALGTADMLERERQYGKAQSKFQEALLLLNELKLKETVQQAHNAQLVIENGYAADYELGGRIW